MIPLLSRILLGCMRMAAWNPRQISSQYVNCKRRKHEDRAHPEAPVGVHAPPIRTGIGFAFVAAHSFVVVLVSCQLLLPDVEFVCVTPRGGAAFIVVFELMLLSLEPAD